jgi:hypothetical protein
MYGGEVVEVEVKFAIFVHTDRVGLLKLLTRGDADVLKVGLPLKEEGWGLRIRVLRLVMLSVAGKGLVVKAWSVGDATFAECGVVVWCGVK